MYFDYSVDNTIGMISLRDSKNKKISSPQTVNFSELNKFLEKSSLKGILLQNSCQNFNNTIDPVFLEVNNTLEKVMKSIHQATIPVAAAIQGSCSTIGLLSSLACHFRFATDSAQFDFSQFSEKALALSERLISWQGIRKSDEILSLIKSGTTLSAEQAHTIGLVDFVITDDDAETKARDFFEALTKKRSPHLIRTIMQSIHNSNLLNNEEALLQESILFDGIVKGRISNSDF